MIHDVQAYLKLIQSALVGSPFSRRVILAGIKAPLEPSHLVAFLQSLHLNWVLGGGRIIKKKGLMGN